MTYIDHTKRIPKYGGTIWYVSKLNGSDSNSGKMPTTPFKTIGKAISSMSNGDAVNIMAETYTETGLDLGSAGSVDYLEMWCERGTLLDPASGTALTLSGNGCKIVGDLKITPDSAEVGVLISGDECKLDNVKTVDGADCYQITGTGTILNNCLGGFPAAGSHGFNILGAQTGLYGCGTVGDTTTCGYYISSSDTGILSDCTSVGHQTSGYYIDTGSVHWIIVDCSTGTGDGKWRDVDNLNVWSGFTYPETKYKKITQDGSGAYELFKITGAVEVQEIFGHVTTQLVGANTDVYLQLSSSGGTSDMTLATGTDLGTATVGSIIMKTEDPNKKITFFNATSASVDKGADPKKKATVCNAGSSGDTYLKYVVTTGDTDGAMDFHTMWRPLTDDGFLEPV